MAHLGHVRPRWDVFFGLLINLIASLTFMSATYSHRADPSVSFFEATGYSEILDLLRALHAAIPAAYLKEMEVQTEHSITLVWHAPRGPTFGNVIDDCEASLVGVQKREG